MGFEFRSHIWSKGTDFFVIGAVDEEGTGTDFQSWSYGGLQMENLSFGDQIRGINVRDSGLLMTIV